MVCHAASNVQHRRFESCCLPHDHDPQGPSLVVLATPGRRPAPDRLGPRGGGLQGGGLEARPERADAPVSDTHERGKEEGTLHGGASVGSRAFLGGHGP